MRKNCDVCSFLNEQNVCFIERVVKTDPSHSLCGNYRNSVPRCDACGLLTTNGILTETKQGWITLCQSCYEKLDTCTMCKTICGVQNDTSGIPKVIPQQIQQGNMIFQTNALNPALTEKYCPSCKCYINNKCMRDKGKCQNYTCRVS